MKKSELRKIIKEEIQKSLSEYVNVDDAFKKGDVAWRLMERDNPQLGTYFVWQQVTVNRVTSRNVICSDGNKYDKESGQRVGGGESVYGSATYTLYTEEEAENRNEELLSAGARVRGFKTT